MTLPNFLIIGTIKGGTTSLHRYLRQHPDVYLPPRKEPQFFSWDPHRPVRDDQQVVCSDPAEYEALFADAGDAKAIGEASPQYLSSPIAPARIRETIPDARIVAILRHPVERALSAYLHLVRDQAETLSFEDALVAEEGRRADGHDPIWLYRTVGLYADQVERYLDLFGPEHVRIYLHEDFERDALGLVQDVFRLLDVDPTFAPDISVRYNASGVPRRRRLFELTTTDNPVRRAARVMVPQRHRERIRVAALNKSMERPPIPPEVRRQLVESFRPDVLRLQELLGRDLSAWLQ